MNDHKIQTVKARTVTRAFQAADPKAYFKTTLVETCVVGGCESFVDNWARDMIRKDSFVKERYAATNYHCDNREV